MVEWTPSTSFVQRVEAIAAEQTRPPAALLACMPMLLRRVDEESAQALRELHGRATAAWPSVTVPATRFAERLANCLVRRLDEGGSAGLGQLEVADLYLLWAAADHDKNAVVRFYEDLLPAATQDLPESVAEEVQHQLLHDLFYCDSPRFTEYTGTASMRGWLKRLARQKWNDIVRDPPKPLLFDQRPPTPTEAQANEEAHARLDARQQLRDLVRELLKLDRMAYTDRAALRQRYIDGLPVTEIARRLQLSYPSLRRWLKYADAELRRMASDIARRRLRLCSTTIADLVRTHLLISLVR